MEEKCRAIVLRAIDYRENDKILTLLSLENGVVSAGIHGVKKAGAKLKFAAEPFCFCEYVLSKKGDRRTVVSADMIESFYRLRADIERFYCGSVALEYVYTLVPEGEGSGETFLLLADLLKTLCFFGASPRTALVKFLFHALALSGYEITVDKCCKCRKSHKNRVFFDFELGAAICEDCRTEEDVEMNRNTLSLLQAVSEIPFDMLSTANFPRMIECKAIRLLSYFTEVKAGVRLRSVGELLLLGK